MQQAEGGVGLRAVAAAWMAKSASHKQRKAAQSKEELAKEDYEALMSFDRKKSTGRPTQPFPPSEPEGEPTIKAEAEAAVFESAVHLRFLAGDLRARAHILQWTLQQMQPGLVVRLVRVAGARLDMGGAGPRSDGSTIGDIVVLLRGTDVLLSRMAAECGFRAQLLNDAQSEGRFASSSDPRDAAAMESASQVRSSSSRGRRRRRGVSQGLTAVPASTLRAAVHALAAAALHGGAGGRRGGARLDGRAAGERQHVPQRGDGHVPRQGHEGRRVERRQQHGYEQHSRGE